MRILLSLLLVTHVSLLLAQTPKALNGLQYRGTAEAEHQDGCEGCGNPGHVAFGPGNTVNYTLPGADIIGSEGYKRKRDTVRLAESKFTMELSGDTLFFTAYDHRHVYLRSRE